MRKLLVVFMLIMGFTALSQSPFTVSQVSKSDGAEASTKAASVHNVWLGSKISGAITGGGDLSENILLSGKIIYDLTLGSFKLPVVSNVSFDFSSGNATGFLFGDQGISIGLYPYKVIGQSGKVTTVIHGGLAYKLLPQESMKLSPQQTKIFAGFEIAHAIKDSPYPFTFSLTPLYAINNLLHENTFALEGTAVLPIAGGLGVLAELTTPFKKGNDAILKVGVIVNGKL